MLPLRHNCLVLLLLLLASPVPGASPARADDSAKITDALSARFFPMQVGSKWVYAFEDKEVTFEVLRTEKSRDTTVFVVRRSLEKHQVEYKLAVEESGVYLHQEGKKVFSPPLRQFAFFPRTGDGWKWRGTFGGKLLTRRFEHLGVDKISVPAGTYTTVSIYEEEDQGDHATYWLAEGVGVVMLSGKSELLGEQRVFFEWKLKRFQKGKD